MDHNPIDHDLPDWLREMLDRAPDLAEYVEQTLRHRGLKWMEEHRGLLESQAAYISTL
jgi:hypothetical protein